MNANLSHRLLFIGGILLCAPVVMTAQEDEVEATEEPTPQTTPPDSTLAFPFGIDAAPDPEPGNGFHFGMESDTYISASFYAVGPENVPTTNAQYSHNIWVSGDLMMVRAGFMDVAMGICYNKNQFFLNQDTLNALGWGGVHDKQKLISWGVGADLKIRFALEPKANRVFEKTVEMGGYFVWNYSRRLKTYNSFDPSINLGSPESKLVDFKLTYLSPVEYGGFARIRYNKLYLVGRYRLSDLFTATPGVNGGAQIDDFERLSIGIGIAFSAD